jgi:uncharacterized phage protein (TIGR01671 family)
MVNMRDIRFRAWDKYTKQMYENVKLDNNGWELCFTYTEGGRVKGYLTRLDKKCDVIIMQYTGLKDKKNGKEIYEGDIVIGMHNQVYEIFMNDETYSFSCCIRIGQNGYTFDSNYDGTLFIKERAGEELEIIGNIYENSDLLEGNQ